MVVAGGAKPQTEPRPFLGGVDCELEEEGEATGVARGGFTRLTHNLFHIHKLVLQLINFMNFILYKIL